MDVKTLCLGALSFGEASGYDIKKFFECTFSHFFVAGYGSIYPALADLTDREYVTCRFEPQEGKPDRKVYELTDAGRQAFVRELEETPPNHKIRSEFLVLMFFAHLLTPEQVAAFMDKRIAEFERQLDAIAQYEEEAAQDGSLDRPAGGRFCCGYGKAVMGAACAYIKAQREEMIEHSRQYNGERGTKT